MPVGAAFGEPEAEPLPFAKPVFGPPPAAALEDAAAVVLALPFTADEDEGTLQPGVSVCSLSHDLPETYVLAALQ